MVWEWIAAFAILVACVEFYMFFNRSPERTVPKKGIVSPANGKVVEVFEGNFSKLFDFSVKGLEKAKLIVIRLSPLNVHVTRAPLNGTIKRVEYQEGKRLPVYIKKSLFKNARNIIVMETGKTVAAIVQISGALARRVVCSVKEGTKIEKGQKIGKIILGSTTVLALPSKQFKINVSRGENVVDGETVLGEFK
ncbi:MAG: phosphatidylserine decarboxylase family protein [Candidatus Aenigmarchaeota archaeon]|nr:phosphatidylserine decarboxylase family protein [Candidatus Aenigmarchaeota archaeon]